MPGSAVPAAARRYFARLGVFFSAYALMVFAAPVLFSLVPPGPLRYVAAAAPALPIVGVIWAMGRYLVEAPDEYQRMRLAQAMLTATGATLSVTTVWGFLQGFDLVAPLPPADIFLMFVGLLGLIQLARRLLDR